MAELGSGGEEYGGVADPWFVVRDSRGRFILASSYGPGWVQRWSPDGEFESVAGGPGDGPSEFRQARRAVVGVGDTLRIFDSVAGTYSVLSPTMEVTRKYLIAAPVEDAIEIHPDYLIVASDLRSPERMGVPLHRLERGRLTSAVETDLNFSRGRPSPYQLNRSIAPFTGGHFVSVHWPTYVIDEWTNEGEFVRTWVRDAEWFDVQPRTTLAGRANPLLVDIATDRNDVTWILALVRSENFDDIAENAGDMRGAGGVMLPSLVSSTGDPDDLEGSILEALDLTTGSVLATRRFPHRLRGFADGQHVWTYVYDDQGGRVVIWRMDVVRP